MTRTKRHYETIAKAVRETVNEDLAAFTPEIAATRVDATRAVAEKLAVVFKRDNARFDRNRFLDACGFPVD